MAPSRFPSLVLAAAAAFLLLGAAASTARADQLAVVRLADGSVLTGYATVTATGLDLTTLDGRTVALDGADVATVEMVPAPEGSAAPTPAPATALPRITAAAPTAAVSRATIPSPPPPPLDVAAVDRAVERAAVAAVPSAAAVPCAPASPCATTPASPWHFRGSLALGFGQGNSDFFDLKLHGAVEREPTPWGFKVSSTYVYGTKEGETNANNWRARGRVERKIGATAYLFAQTLYERDPLADLVYRYTFTLGAGWTLVKNAADDLDLEAGIGGTLEKRTDVSKTFDPSGWLGTDWKHCFSEGRKLEVSYSFRPNFGDFDLSASTFEARYSTPCFDCVDLELALRLEHVINPPDGTDPLDILFTVGMTFDR